MKKLNKLLIVLLLIFGINGVKAEGYATVSCGLVDGIPAALPAFTTNIINIVKILVPVILIILGMIDFAKAVASSDEKVLKDSRTKFVRRIIGAIAVFVVIAVIQLIFNMIGGDSSNEMLSCINCFTNNSCSTIDPYKICISNIGDCNKNCYNATGSYDSSEFYSCANQCYNDKYKSCEEKYANPDNQNEAYNCSDYTYYNCPSTSKSGMQCKKNQVKQTCQYAEIKFECDDYTVETCPERDELNDVCKIENNACVRNTSVKKCSDYSFNECPTSDEDGNECKIESTGGVRMCVEK